MRRYAFGLTLTAVVAVAAASGLRPLLWGAAGFFVGAAFVMHPATGLTRLPEVRDAASHERRSNMAWTMMIGLSLALFTLVALGRL